MELSAINADTRAELRKEIMQEIAAEKVKADLNKNLIKLIFSEYEDDFKSFDWSDRRIGNRPDGTPFYWTNQYTMHYKVKQALSTLIKAHLKVKRNGQIPIAKYEEVKNITEQILAIIKNNCD